MKVICAGMPKAGAKSIAKALRHLGLTVFHWEEQIFDFLDHWVNVFEIGIKPVVVGHPAVFFYEEIQEAFPDCKVILSIRDEDSWVKSAVNQIELLYARRHKLSLLSSTARKAHHILDRCIDASFGSCNPKSTYVFRKLYSTPGIAPIITV